MNLVYELTVDYDALDAAVNACLPGYADWGTFRREELTQASSQYHLADHDNCSLGSVTVRKLGPHRSEIAVEGPPKPPARGLTAEERACIRAECDREARIARVLEVRRAIDGERDAEYRRRRHHQQFVVRALFNRLAHSGVISTGRGARQDPEPSGTAQVLENVTIEDIADRTVRLIRERGGVDIQRLGSIEIRQIGDQWWMIDRGLDDHGHLKRFGLELQRLAQHGAPDDEEEAVPAGLMAVTIDLPTSGPLATIELERIGVPAGVKVTIRSHRKELDPAFEELVDALAENWPELWPHKRKAGAAAGGVDEVSSVAASLAWTGKLKRAAAAVAGELVLVALQVLTNMLTSRPEVRLGLTVTIVLFAICLALYIGYQVKKALAA